MRKLNIYIIFLMLISSIFSQIKSDPRMIGMGGAYITLSEGYRCVGFNPANLAYGKQFSINLLSGTTGFANNLLSLITYNEINGADLENSNADKYYPKADLLNLTDGEDLELTINNHIPLPLINYSKGVIAITSDIMLLSDITIPYSMMELSLIGNEIGQEYIFSTKENILGVAEYGISLAVPYENYAVGFTFKYLQGLFFVGIDQDSSYATFAMDSTSFYGEGRYLIRQAVGGSGVAMDIGFATKESAEGWRFGVSLTNLFGAIEWNKPNFTRDLIGDSIKDILPFRQNEYFVYEYTINNVNGLSLIGEGSEYDSLFISNGYTVVETDSGLVSSEDLSDEELMALELKDFSTDYPLFFRFGISKRFKDQWLLATDLSTGFHNELNSYNKWKLSVGIEINRFKHCPIRMGYTLGGKSSNGLSFGSGLHLGPLKFDFGVALRNGFLLHTAKGFDFSLGLIFTY